MTSNGAQRLSEVLREARADIERRWLERVLADLVKTPGLSLTQLRDGIPDYLIALQRLLRGDDGDLDPTGGAAWTQVAREHGITRVRIGFDISQLVHEFVALRQVIHEVAIERGLSDADLAGARLADILDAAIAAAVRAYADARDFEARQKQAENIGFLIHELRNPLSAAMMSSTALRSASDGERDELLGTLDRGLRRLAGLINGVLQTQKLEAGKIESVPKPVLLEPLVRRAVEVARLAAESKGLLFEIGCDSTMRVEIDPELTSSALQNLADNAVKYTDGGLVEIRVEQRADDFAIHVRDSCHGISQEELRIVFEPFRRGRSGKSGTGLGLAIAKRAVEAQGGKIEAESSAEAGGCHFWITLPKAPRKTAA